MAEQNPEDEVVLRRFNNAFDAELALQFLRDHDLKARLSGVGSSALFDRLTTVTDLRLIVRRRDYVAAKEALSAMDMPVESGDPEFRAAGAAQGDDDSEHRAPYRDGVHHQVAATMAEEARHKDRRSRIGVIAGIFIPGGGHIYARQPWAGLVFFLFFTFALGFSRDSNMPWLGLAALMILCYDVLHAVIAVDQHNRGNDPSRRSQLAHGALAVCIASIASFAISLVRPTPAAATVSTTAPVTP
jgi:hypothetical protein